MIVPILDTRSSDTLLKFLITLKKILKGKNLNACPNSYATKKIYSTERPFEFMNINPEKGKHNNYKIQASYAGYDKSLLSSKNDSPQKEVPMLGVVEALRLQYMQVHIPS